MSKVILTQEQADRIKALLRNDDRKAILEHHIRITWEGAKNIILNKLSSDDMARVLYEPNSYEVKPEFKSRDWVYRMSDKKIYKVDFVTEEGLILDDENLWMFNEQGNDYGKHTPLEDVRHATSEEKTKERERRWWAKHGRDVREVRSGDIIYSYSTGVTFVRNDNARHITSFDGFQVVCFVENRLDVKDDE